MSNKHKKKKGQPKKHIKGLKDGVFLKPRVVHIDDTEPYTPTKEEIEKVRQYLTYAREFSDVHTRRD